MPAERKGFSQCSPSVGPKARLAVPVNFSGNFQRNEAFKEEKTRMVFQESIINSFIVL